MKFSLATSVVYGWVLICCSYLSSILLLAGLIKEL